MNTTWLSDDDVQDIETALHAIEGLLMGFGDSDVHGAAARLHAVLQRHSESRDLLDSTPPDEVDALVQDFAREVLKDPQEVRAGAKTYIHVPTDGPPVTFEVEAGKELPELQRRVGGPIASASYVVEGHTAYVHDEGLLIGLPINYIVSQLFKQTLVGDAVIVGPVDAEGDTASVTAWMRGMLGV